jgi:DNA-binding transcriptional regulator GbsR (MarR family)
MISSMPSDPSRAAQDHHALLVAVEQVASLLAEGGLPRMAARVFAYALAEDSDRYTAADFAEGLRISPAAVSGAVRFLTSTRLLFKERAPGSRADLYRVYDEDVWSTIMSARLPMLEVWEKAVREAAETVGTDTRGGRRLRETEEFFRFTRAETEAMIERWKDHRRGLDGGPQPIS